MNDITIRIRGLRDGITEEQYLVNSLARNVPVGKTWSTPISVHDTCFYETEMKNDYYVRNRKKIVGEFDGILRAAAQVAKGRLDEETMKDITESAWAELDRLLPTMPYVGGEKSRFTGMMFNIAETLALYRACKGLDLSSREIGQMIYEITEIWAQSMSPRKRRLAKALFFTRLMKNRWRRCMRDTQMQDYPGNWVGTFIEGDGETFDYGLDFTECAWVKLVKTMGVEEIAPYVCLTDYAKMRAIGVGFRRDQAIAMGGERCEFRFSKTLDTQRGWPPEEIDEMKEWLKKQHSKSND